MRKAQRLQIPYEFGEDPDEFYSSVACASSLSFSCECGRASES